MKAISVFPGKPDSVHIADLPKPTLDQVPGGRGAVHAHAQNFDQHSLTDPVKGLENYTELFKKPTSPNGAIKVFCQVAEL